MPYDTRVLETGTTFANETDGVWTLTDWTGDGRHQDLIFIKTGNTGTGRVEVHVASGASQYQQRIWESGSTFLPETDGTWMMADFTGDGKVNDLIYIKTAHCGSCRVEVHVASAASGYKTRVLETPTVFLPRNDGTWTMADTTGDGKLDLIFIQTSNTNFGKVEVHIASGASNYGELVLNTSTVFENDNGGTWLLTPFDLKKEPLVQDLVLIKAGPNMIRDKMEIIEADKEGQGSAYSARTFASDCTFFPESDGTWCMANYSHTDRPDLVFIKTANTPSGTVEVHIAKY